MHTKKPRQSARAIADAMLHARGYASAAPVPALDPAPAARAADPAARRAAPVPALEAVGRAAPVPAQGAVPAVRILALEAAQDVDPAAQIHAPVAAPAAVPVAQTAPVAAQGLV